MASNPRAAAAAAASSAAAAASPANAADAGDLIDDLPAAEMDEPAMRPVAATGMGTGAAAAAADSLLPLGSDLGLTSTGLTGGKEGASDELTPIEQLKQFWINERAAPELLHYEEESISFIRGVIDRRAHEIRQQQGKPNQQIHEKGSVHEVAFCKGFVDLLHAHLHGSFLQNLPAKMQSWIDPARPADDMLEKPDSANSYVVFKVKADIEEYIVPGQDDPVTLREGDLIVGSWAVYGQLFREGLIDLL